MIKIVKFPGKYIQGYNALYSVDKEIKDIGSWNSFILYGPFVYKYVLDKTFICSLDGTHKEFFGECTDEEIDKCVNIVDRQRCDLIIGVGGGKILDTAKAIADVLDLPIITIPTSLTNAAGSALSVIYTIDGKLLFLTDKPIDIIDSLYDYYIKMELPVSLKGIGLNNIDDDKLLEAVNYMFMEGSSIYNELIFLIK